MFNEHQLSKAVKVEAVREKGAVVGYKISFTRNNEDARSIEETTNSNGDSRTQSQ